MPAPPPYAPIVTPADLKNLMYPEVQAIITRGDTSIAVEAIDTAIQEAKSYLSRYDLVQLFGNQYDLNCAATVNDKMLNNIIKNMAVWYLCRLSNVNIDLSIARTAYEDAIDTLKSIRKGMCQPELWPYLDTTGETAPPGDSIYATSNCKQNFFF